MALLIVTFKFILSASTAWSIMNNKFLGIKFEKDETSFVVFYLSNKTKVNWIIIYSTYRIWNEILQWNEMLQVYNV
jgi:hypothetical protein